MTKAEFVRESCLGGPGHDGYAYDADVYCVDCGQAIIRDIACVVAPTLTGTDDPSFADSGTVPQPIFLGESDTAQYCGECGEHLYGDDPDEPEES